MAFPRINLTLRRSAPEDEWRRDPLLSSRGGSKISRSDPNSGNVTPFITGLPTGDHPNEQLAFKGGWIYWSQGSTTNSGVVGRDNNGGLNQPDIPCQNITLSQNLFDSGSGVKTSGYEPFGTGAPGYRGDGARLQEHADRRHSPGCLRWRHTAGKAQRSEHDRVGTGTATPSGLRPIIIRWPASYWLVKTVPTSAGRDLRMALRK